MTVCGTSGAGKIIDPREAIVGRGAYLHARMHVRLLKPGWFTDTALSGSMAAYCMADSGVSVNLPMRQLSKEQSGDETGGAADGYLVVFVLSRNSNKTTLSIRRHSISSLSQSWLHTTQKPASGQDRCDAMLGPERSIRIRTSSERSTIYPATNSHLEVTAHGAGNVDCLSRG
ncbi:hypothetical protein FOC1_g10006896 [Fusarium oxysporum f. sp. cubense race 1]|uniref:Uncharacterized protein n=1 Tax=Fusarium oxysporum f. sp. cubense (strain race 1) TaxID=1229664 RepID=N4U290_FUSC1|nr:hypothetical protein FOC1_g10006896 [Fusarium oxysporum f. sp. cubense race 1]